MYNPNYRKSCVVPKCTNTTTNAPEKLFIIVPMDVKMRKKWLQAMKRVYPFGDRSKVYCCEDHFDLPNDMENYIRYRVMGSVSQVRMKRGCIPTRFECQTERRKPTLDTVTRRCHRIHKKRRKILIEESVKELEERSTAAKCLEPGETLSVKFEKTDEGREERGWVPRYRQEAPKASDRTLAGDKETRDVNDDGETLPMDKEDSWWAEDHIMDGIETVEVADDVTTPTPREFSWHRPPETIPCADDVEFQIEVSLTAPDAAGGVDGDDRRPIESYNDRLHLGYKCNECGSEIVGYRYTCVQCLAVDLCGACEAGGAHPAHYVLRLPRPEPAGAVKGVLETLRGLLDHLPLQALHEVKKEETDDADPLSCGYLPPEPFIEDADSDFQEYEENEELIQEDRPPLEDKLSLSDLRPLNVDVTSSTPCTTLHTANIQHPASEHSLDKVRLDVGNRSSRKVLLRLKKLSEINDNSAVKCSVVRPCEGEIETKTGARAASGVSLAQLGAGVAKLGAGVAKPGAGVAKPGAGVAKPGAGVAKLEAGVAKSGAGVATSGASVTSVGAGSGVPGAPASIPMVKLERMDNRLLRGDGTWTLIP